MRKNIYKQEGFTLVEVLVAIAVLTIGLLALAAMQSKSIEFDASAIRVTKSTTWNENRIEILMARSYNHADLQDTNSAGIAAGSAGLNCTDGTAPACLADGGPIDQINKDGRYRVYWNVAVDYPVFGCKTIRVITRRVDNELWRPPIVFEYIKMEPI